MSFEDQLNGLDPARAGSPASRLRQALELYDEGVALQRLSFARRFPNLDASALDAKVHAWLLREEEEGQVPLLQTERR